MGPVRRYVAAVAVGLLVALTGAAAYAVWAGGARDAREREITAETNALYESVLASVAGVVARSNYLRGAVEANPSEAALQRAFEASRETGFASGAAVLDVSDPERPRVVRTVGGEIPGLDQILASAPLPEPGDDLALLESGVRNGFIEAIAFSRRGDRGLLHAVAFPQAAVAAASAIDHPTIDYVVSTVLLDGSERVILTKPLVGFTGEATPLDAPLSQAGIEIRIKTRAAEGLAPAVTTRESGLWAAAILALAILAGGVVLVSSRRRSQLAEADQREREALHRSLHDQLTDLPNRAALFQRLEDRSPTEQISMLFIDLDGFKRINDAHGHVVGDGVLETIAARLRAGLRRTDAVYRLAGDEFVVVCSAANDLDVLRDRLLHAIEQPIALGDTIVHTSASIGVTPQVGERETPRQALQVADQAMYAEKRNRGGAREAD